MASENINRSLNSSQTMMIGLTALKPGKKNSLWNTNAVVVKSNDLLTAKKTNLTLNELRIILVGISKIDSMNPEVRGDASYWVSAKELREIGAERL